MVASAFFFSLMSLFVKAVGRGGLPSHEIVLWRGVITVCLSYAALRRARISPWGRPANRRLLILRGLFGFGALSCFFYAVVHLPLADATVIQYTNPVFTALIAAVVLSEPIGGREAAAVTASLVGVVAIARPSFLFDSVPGRLDPLAVGVALAGAVLSAAAYVTVRRLGRSEHPLVIVHYFAVIVVLGSLPVTALGIVWPSPIQWAGLAGVGVTTHIAQVYLTRGLALEPAGRAMAVGYVQIVFAAVLGALFFAEFPDLWAAMGALLIVASTFSLGRRVRDMELEP